MTSSLLRTITNDEIETFWRDGVVCLRKVVDPDLLRSMEAPLAALFDTSEVADLSAMGDAIAKSGNDVQRGDVPLTGRGRFFAGVDHWREHDQFHFLHAIHQCPKLQVQLCALRLCVFGRTVFLPKSLALLSAQRGIKTWRTFMWRATRCARCGVHSTM